MIGGYDQCPIRECPKCGAQIDWGDRMCEECLDEYLEYLIDREMEKDNAD